MTTPASKAARLKPVLDDMARGVNSTLRELCEKVGCIGREENKQPSNVTEPAPPASQRSTLPPARGEREPSGSSVLTDGANGEKGKDGANGEGEKEAPVPNEEIVADVMEEDDDDIELPPIEFDPEVQAKLMRWQPDFPECSITLCSPMPTYMSQGQMMDAAKAALSREKQLLDMRVKAGSRVVIKVHQAELNSWIGERNWFVLENEETKSFREIWCLPPRVDRRRPEMKKESAFTIQIKGIGIDKYSSDYIQQQLSLQWNGRMARVNLVCT